MKIKKEIQDKEDKQMVDIVCHRDGSVSYWRDALRVEHTYFVPEEVLAALPTETQQRVANHLRLDARERACRQLRELAQK